MISGAVVVSAAMWTLAQVDVDTTRSYVLTAHILLSVGLGLIFTPLFSTGLGSLAPQLYSHGSAIVSTVQQLAGAVGTALFITLLSRTVADADPSLSAAAATADGVHTALFVGAIISTVAAVVALFVRKPPAYVEPSAGPAPGPASSRRAACASRRAAAPQRWRPPGPRARRR